MNKEANDPLNKNYFPKGVQMNVQRVIEKSLGSKIFVVFTLIAIIITSSTFLMSPVEPRTP